MTKEPPVLLVRADADAKIGAGHVLRCLALVQAWMEMGGRAVFLCSQALPVWLQSRLQDGGTEVYLKSFDAGSETDAFETAEAVSRFRPGWLVLDGYSFRGTYFQAFKKECRVLVIDDTADCFLPQADAVLNPNAYAEAGLYENRVSPDASLLTGASYALLRSEFRRSCPRRETPSSVASRILVTLGGGDNSRVTECVLDALQLAASHPLEIRVITGIDMPLAFSKHSVRVETVKAPRSMVPHYEWADLAVTGGGSTCWETAYMGLPSLCVIIAENQRRIVEFLNQKGVAVSLGWENQLTIESAAALFRRVITDVEGRARMSRSGRQLIDGRGAERAAEFLKTH